MSTDDWMTTGEAASFLGVSRQHVVDLCDRGELPFGRPGTHRRIRRSDLQHLIRPRLTREKEKSLWLHRAVLGRLMIEPDAVLEKARANLRSWSGSSRPDGRTAKLLQEWDEILTTGVDAVVVVLSGEDERSVELRQSSPFAGVLSDVERRQALRSFRDYWDAERSAA